MEKDKKNDSDNDNDKNNDFEKKGKKTILIMTVMLIMT